MSSGPTGLVRARTTRLAAADGLVPLEAGVPVGREYLIDLRSLRVATLFNVDQQVSHVKTVVDIMDEATGHRSGGLPVELLEMP
jgi:hypothetical protein